MGRMPDQRYLSCNARFSYSLCMRNTRALYGQAPLNNTPYEGEKKYNSGELSRETTLVLQYPVLPLTRFAVPGLPYLV